MVFSFFKKDTKDDKKKSPVGRGKPEAAGRGVGLADANSGPTPKPIGRPLPPPAARGAPASGPRGAEQVPDRERARHNARATAAKIDEIEAEMARDLLGGSSRSGRAAPATRPTPVVLPDPTTLTAPSTGATAEPLADPIEANSVILTGNIDAIEISESAGSSVLDETAVLFANGESDAAEAMLRAALRRDDLGGAAKTAWHMLFELVNDRGDRTAYEQLSMDYALRFEASPPAWIDYRTVTREASAAAPPAAASGICVRLPPTLDAGIVGHLQQLRDLTAAHAAVELDVSDAQQIDLAGASLLLRVIGAFRRSDRQLTVVGAEALAATLSRTVEAGRRDPADSLWMLWLEVLRLLDRPEEFEEAAIQYCITFEVSPPSWEPPPANLRIAPARAPLSAAPAPRAAGSPLFLQGVIDGDGEPHIGRLVSAARGEKEVVIDCSQLRRLSFAAGSALPAALRRIRQNGTASVELRNVSAIVGALLYLLGVGAVATIHLRHG